MQKKRTLTDNEKQLFLDLKPDDITKTLLTDLFADRFDATKGEVVHSRFNTYDEFILKPGEYPTIKEPIKTNCGLFIVNKFLFEEDWIDLIGYMNTPMDKKQINAIDDVLSSAVNDDEEGTIREKYVRYINKHTWLQLTFHTEICASISLKSSKPLPETQKKKKQLIQKYSDKLKQGDVTVAAKIQEELIKSARSELQGDPTLELYESGARGAFDNAYRQAQLIKGPIYNAANNKFEIMTNSLYEGADKNDLPAFANAVVDGAYPKAISTAESGYDSKKLIASLQSEVLDDRGSDCKSKYPLNITITKGNYKSYKYHYIVEGSKLVRLDDSNKDKYIGKAVKMRLPSTCCGDKICNVCIGDRFYLLGIKNAGLTSAKLSNSLLNAKMKQSHDTTVRTYELDPDSMFSPSK